MLKFFCLGSLMFIFSLPIKSTEAEVPIKAKVLGGGLIISQTPDGTSNNDISLYFGEIFRKNIPMRDDSDITPQAKTVYIKTSDGNLPIETRIKVSLYTLQSDGNNSYNFKYLMNEQFVPGGAGDIGNPGKNSISHLLSASFKNVDFLEYPSNSTIDVANKTIRILGNDNITKPDYYGFLTTTNVVLLTKKDSDISVDIKSRIVETLASERKPTGKFKQKAYLKVEFPK